MKRKEKIMKRLNEHYREALKYFPEERIVGIFCQGSQNYNLDTKESDLDTKLIVVPSFEEIALNKDLVNKVYILENKEHMEAKDFRLLFKIFHNQNSNYLEVLFTEFSIINPLFSDLWEVLVDNREKIARANKFRGVNSMLGVAYSHFNRLELTTSKTKETILDKGYNPKELMYLLYLNDFVHKFLDGEKYETCLKAENPEYLLQVKKGCYTCEEALELGRNTFSELQELVNNYLNSRVIYSFNPEVEELFKDIQKRMLKIALKGELM